MPFIEKVKKIATGKTEDERRQEAAASAVIRQKSRAAALQERQRQTIRVATEREKIIADRRIKRMRQPRPIFGGYGSPFGQPVSPQPRIRTVTKKKPKLKKVKKRYVKSVQRYSQPQRFDVVGGSMFGQQNKGRHRVI